MTSSLFLRSLTRSGAVAALSLLGATSALAQSSQIDLGPAPVGSVAGDISFKELISFAATYLISISGGIAVLFLVYGGIVYMTAGGSDDKVQSAKKIMRNAIVGLVIVLLAFVIISNTLKISYSIKGGQTGGGAITVSPAQVTLTSTAPTNVAQVSVNCPAGASPCSASIVPDAPATVLNASVTPTSIAAGTTGSLILQRTVGAGGTGKLNVTNGSATGSANITVQ